MMDADPDTDFTREEYEGRLARLRARMAAAAIDVMLVDDCEMLAYFTGYEVSLNLYRACLVPMAGTPLMVLRRLDAAPFLAQAWFDRHAAFLDDEEPGRVVANAIAAFGCARGTVGYDPSSHALTLGTFDRLRRALPEARFVPVAPSLWDLRLVKSPAEIARLARAAGMLDAVMAELVRDAAPGLTARQAAARASGRLIALGGDPGHVGYVAAAKGWDFLHAALDDRPLARGDVLHLELVSRYRGYDARMMRCVSIGPLDPARREAAATLAALQDAQIAAMKPGAAARAVDAILRDGVVAAGLRESYANITGYTLGFYSKVPIRSSDFTRTFSPAAEWQIEAGMAFHVYASARGVALSETVVVRETGAERLTRLDRRIFASSAA